MFEKLVAWYSRLPFPRRKPGLLRLVSWAERFRGRRNWAKAKVDTPAGSVFLEVDLNAWLQREMFYHGVFEPDIQFAIQAYCKPGDTVCDVGANIGVYTTQMSKLVGPHGRVIAFEPTEKFHKRLKRNLELNHSQNVLVNKLIVSDHVGTHEISISDQTASINLLSDCQQKETIESTTLDIHLKDMDSLSLMKIDVDGWDFHVLNGAQQIIRKHRPLIIVECTRSKHSEPKDILSLLTQLNYDLYLDSDRSQQKKLFVAEFERLAAAQKSFDVVAVPQK
jgi:FkbM family methyltransferase